MKKRLILLMSAAFLALWACQKDPAVEPVDNTPKEMTVSMTSIAAERTGGDFAVTVTAPSRPSVTSKPDWVKVQDGTYNSSTYKITLTLTVSAFGDYGSREGDVVISAGALSKTISITQQGREKPNVNLDAVPVTAGATAGAKSLYGYLLEQYGNAVISGVMADVAWNTDIAEKVNEQAGKYPAINCFDFIHIQSSGSWINYSDISPVKKWHDAGGIVALMWHFNVPVSEGSESISFYSENNTFKPSRALQEGTWEHAWYMKYLEEVADVILQLQEEGIAAIWRPYHEAAGNYYALKWQGSAWFWWGTEGPEVYKQLWNHMFDYFAAKGIRNLIWVWTAQGTNQDASSYGSDVSYYPGDDKVDLVARDVYGSSAQKTADDFSDIQNTYPHKMVALGECGRSGSVEFPLIGDIWQKGGRWAWFMPWCDNHYTMVDTAWWKAAFAADYVITRDQLPDL